MCAGAREISNSGMVEHGPESESCPTIDPDEEKVGVLRCGAKIPPMPDPPSLDLAMSAAHEKSSGCRAGAAHRFQRWSTSLSVLKLCR